MTYLIVGLDRTTLTPWHRNVSDATQDGPGAGYDTAMRWRLRAIASSICA